jgi:Zn-dependent metalloprotease
MCSHRNPIQCIVPPHILKGMLQSKDARVREAAVRTLVSSAKLRAQRAVVGSVRAALAAPTGNQKQRTIYDARHLAQLPGRKIRDEGQQAAQDAAVNDAYDGLGATYDLYTEAFKRNSIDGHGLRLIASVHYQNGFNNAFWNGQQMVFGDGDGVIFVGFTKAIDVIGHELTHGVTQYTCNLNYENQPGALNESFSDVFGSMVKQHALGQDVESADWLIGSGILAPGINGTALRSMADPGSAYDDPKLGGKDPQPKHMDHFVELPNDDLDDSGGVHINSGIPNHAFYLVAKQLGGHSWEDAGTIWYKTLLQLWQDAQFADCANVSVQVAAAQFGTTSNQYQAVKNAWDEVGVHISAPEPGAARKRSKAPAAGRPAAFESDGSMKKLIEKLIEALNRNAEALT